MINYETFINGIVKFIDNEITPQMTGFKKLAFGVGSSIVLKKGDNVFNLVKDNQLIHALGILDDQNNIDIDMLKQEIASKMGDEKYSIEIPMIGTITLNKGDLEKLYRYMKEQG